MKHAKRRMGAARKACEESMESFALHGQYWIDPGWCKEKKWRHPNCWVLLRLDLLDPHFRTGPALIYFNAAYMDFSLVFAQDKM
jgi:hypothetical protein